MNETKKTDGKTSQENLSKQLVERYGTDKHSYPSYSRWENQVLREWCFLNKEKTREKESIKRKIEELKQEIVELRNLKKNLKRIAKPKIDKENYEKSKQISKEGAESEGWTWVEPEQEAEK